MELPAMTGFGHLDLTVTDVDRSVRWWKDVMGFEHVHTRRRPEYTLCTVMHSSGFFLGLMEHTDGNGQPFDERAAGLDHFALRVPDRAALDAWAARLSDLGVEHSGVCDESAGPLIVLRDPDNIQLELWVFEPERVDPDRLRLDADA